MSKNETIATNGSRIRPMIVCQAMLLIFSGSKCPVLRILLGKCDFCLLMRLHMVLQLLYVKTELFYFISVSLWAWFSIFFVSYEPEYTQIDLTRKLISPSSFPV